MKYKLRPYQQEASDAAVKFFKDETANYNALIVAPTGCGKSCLIADIAYRIGGSVLVLQPSKEILQQNFAKMQSYGVEDIAIYSASCGVKEIARITFATIGSIMAHIEDFNKFRAIIIDECHAVNPKEGMYKKFLTHVKRKVLGLTATPYRLSSQQGKMINGEFKPVPFKKGQHKWMKDIENRCMEKMLTRTVPKMFSKIIYQVPIQTLLEQGYLSRLRYFSMPVINTAKVKRNSTGQDFDEVSLRDEMLKCCYLNKVEEIVKRLLEPKSEEDRRTGILVFTKFVDESKELSKAIPNSAVVSGDTPKADRERILEDFKSGKIKVLLNCSVLTTGFDYPALDTVVMARPTMSLAMYYQCCLDMETEILTKDGFKKYKDISYSDKVAAYNDGEILWADIQEIIHRKAYSGEEWVYFKNQHNEFRVSGDHMMLAKSEKAQCGYKLQTAKELMRRKGLFRIPVSGVMQSEGLPLTDAQVRFIGYVLSDGYVDKSNGAIIISQSLRYPQVLAHIEETLKECGFRYCKHLIKRKGDMAKYYDVYHFNISHGEPRRKEERHLHGWNIIDKYITGCKRWNNEYWKLSEHQFDVLLSAINEGDGSKHATADYTPRTYTIAFGIRKDYVEKMQALAVMRGWRCNLKVDTHNREYPLYVMLMKKQGYTTIAGACVKDERGYHRGRLVASKMQPNDEMWCVRNQYGTIITRHNGYVTIMGNCGRAIRPFEGKKGWVVDLCGNVERFGEVENLQLVNDEKGLPAYIGYVGGEWKYLTGVYY